MKKIILLTLVLFVFNTLILAQDSKNYSESNPYTIREFSDKKKKKKKRKKIKYENFDAVVSADGSVIIPVTVAEPNGEIVTNLKKEDFRIFIDGAELKEFTLEERAKPLNLIMLFDTSPSVTFQEDEFEDYALKMVDNLLAEDRILIADFNEKLKIRTELTNDKEYLRKRIKKIKYGNGTAVYDAVSGIFMEQISKLPSDARNALIIVSDGVDTVSEKSDYRHSLEIVEKFSIPVFVVYLDNFEQLLRRSDYRNRNFDFGVNRGMGTSIPEYKLGANYLSDLVLLSGGRNHYFKDISIKKEIILPKFTNEMRYKYYLKFKPQSSAEERKRHQLKVRVNRPDLLIFSKGSYILE